MKLLATLAILCSSTAFAAPADLRVPAVAEFLRQANEAHSALGQQIAQHNRDTTDGRNPNGTIRIPVTAQALQVIATEGEDMLNPWHYGELSKDKLTCMASGDSAAFLIALNVETGVHMAHESGTRLFTITASEALTFPAEQDTEASCQEQVDRAKVKRTVTFSEIEEVTLQKGAAVGR